MTDLKQFQEDSFASAMRRYSKIKRPADHYIPEPGTTDKIKEELYELDVAILSREVNGKNFKSKHCPSLTAVEEELADVILACLMFAKLEGIDIDKALNIKNEFNKVRL